MKKLVLCYNQTMKETVKLEIIPGLADFLISHKTLTMANSIDKKGTIHAAAMLYFCTIDPLKFYLITSRNTDKYNLLKTHKSIQCAVVVGTEKGTPYSIQMRGDLQEIETSNNKKIIKDYYKKSNNKYDDINDPMNCLLEFTPTWARYLDYSNGCNKYYLNLNQK